MVRLKAVRATSLIMRLSGAFQLAPFIVILLVRMVVLPILLYGAPVWCPSAPSAGSFVECEEIIVKPVRSVLSLPWNCGRNALMFEVGLLP